MAWTIALVLWISHLCKPWQNIMKWTRGIFDSTQVCINSKVLTNLSAFLEICKNNTLSTWIDGLKLVASKLAYIIANFGHSDISSKLDRLLELL